LERLFDKNTQLLNDLEENMKFASVLLERGNVQKTDAMEMLDEVNKAKEMAQKAVDEGDATLSKANETLQTLQSFQSQVTESSLKAQTALEKVPEIRQQIVNTEDIINVAEEALDNAHQNAKEARKNAQEAQEKYADQASKEADSIRRRANEAKTEAEKLHSEADQLNSRVAATEHRIENLEEVAGRDDQLTEAAKEKVGQAKSDSEKAQKQLEKAMDEVKMIMNELENMKEISIADLNLLDERLNRTEAELDKAKLNDRIQTLHDLKNHQNRWIKQYQTEIVTLEKEVANIKSIANALPTGCFKRTRLEP
jgi:coxsackievirus/adenovirus receptor